jgi:hypothetical protein
VDVDRANCFLCVVKDRDDIRIECAPVFASLCGHVTCTTQTWHPVCLMEYRESFVRATDQHAADTPPILIAIRVLRQVSN